MAENKERGVDTTALRIHEYLEKQGEKVPLRPDAVLQTLMMFKEQIIGANCDEKKGIFTIFFKDRSVFRCTFKEEGPTGLSIFMESGNELPDAGPVRISNQGPTRAH